MYYLRWHFGKRASLIDLEVICLNENMNIHFWFNYIVAYLIKSAETMPFVVLLIQDIL